MNIPIYRAKKIDSEEYVEGYLLPCEDGEDLYIKHCVDTSYINADYFKEYDYQWFEDLIDPITLAIHFPDMLDSEGNKVFASFQDNGEGGDELRITTPMGYYTDVYIYRNCKICNHGNSYTSYTDLLKESKHIEILGIRHWE